MATPQYNQAKRTRWWSSLSRGGTDADEVIAESGISFQLWRLYQHFWLVCLLFPLVQVVRSSLSPAQLITGMGALIFFAASYTWLMWRHPTQRGMRACSHAHLQLLLWLVLVGEALALSLTSGLSFLWLFIGVSATAGVLFPLGQAFVVVSLLMFLPPLVSVITSGGFAGVEWPLTIALTLLVRALGLDMLGAVRMASALRELHATRKELARRSVEEERQRLARDLHDLLGQTLSMITLKSELAGWLIEEDPRRCAQEVAEIERISRQTLREVREAVAGYRQPTLASELEGAQQLLEAAGIEVQIDPRTDPLPPVLDAALAWAVREGVTNVIRHSRARRCCIRLIQENETVGAEILNDGGEREQKEKLSRRGLGLAGLRERVSLLGGELEADSLLIRGKEHFRLFVELPFPKGREAPTFQEEQA